MSAENGISSEILEKLMNAKTLSELFETAERYGVELNPDLLRHGETAKPVNA